MKHVNPSLISLFGRVKLPSNWIAWLVLSGSLFLTLIGWRIAQNQEQEVMRAQFAARSGDVVQRIQQRMQTYEYVLRGAAALFAAARNVDRNAWHEYVASLKIDDYMSGIQGVGFAPLISAGEKDALINRVRAEGYPDFIISPPGQRSVYTPVIYLEPFRDANLRAFGYDMFSEPLRRTAMERARDTDQIAVSGKVTLVQESGEKKQAGFLMFMPVYKNGQPRDTLEAKRSALLGYVYSPFRMDDLMAGIVGRAIPDLDVHIYDGEVQSPSALMFDSVVESIDKRKDIPEFTTTTQILVGGHHWTVTAASLPSFERNGRGKSPRIVAVLGVFISLLLFFIARFQERMRKRAIRIAEDMSAAYFESELQLQAILDNSPYIAWLKDLHGRYLKVNKLFLNYAQLSDADEIVGKTDFDLWSKEFAEKYHLDDVEVIQSRQQKSLEEQTTDGKTMHWMETVKTPVLDEEGRVLGTTGFARDISERKYKELQIIRLGQVYGLLSRINEAIIRVQGRDELFAAICKAAVTSGLFRFIWIGLLDEERLAVNTMAYAGVEEDYTNRLHIRLDDDRTGNGPVGTAIRTGSHVICSDIENDPIMAPWRDVALKRGYRSSAGFPIREQDVVVGVINIYAGQTGFFTPDIVQVMLEMAADVSFALEVFAEKQRRKLAEEKIVELNLELEHRVQERTHQLEEVNRELEAFSYSVSHDLRAPLRSIDGFSQILSKKYHDSLDDTGRDYLERVRRASQRMGHLIDDLLQLSRVTRNSLRREQVDLSALAESVVADLRKMTPQRQVHFVLQSGLSAYADPGLLRIVMDNLLGNACKFTGKTSEAEIEFGMLDYDGENTFFIRDNGAGFNMGYVHKLFGAFQRLHGANEFEGTGIGLATVQRIIHRHHGKVWAEGQEGIGATFFFTLPQRMRNT